MDFDGRGVKAYPAMPALVVTTNRVGHAVDEVEGGAIQLPPVAVKRNDDGVALASHLCGGEVG